MAPVTRLSQIDMRSKAPLILVVDKTVASRENQRRAMNDISSPYAVRQIIGVAGVMMMLKKLAKNKAALGFSAFVPRPARNPFSGDMLSGIFRTLPVVGVLFFVRNDLMPR